MKLYLVLCLCSLVTFIEPKVGKKPLTREQIIEKVGNKDMIAGRENSLVNIPPNDVYEEYIARDCRGAYLNGRRQNGLYVIKPKNSSLIAVYCEMQKYGGGWTVLQRNNINENTAWALPWPFYKTGFGNLEGSHWLGNEFIHLLTRQRAFTVKFVLVLANGTEMFANYHSFELDSEANGYTLRLGDYSGNTGDALTVMYETGVHDNMKFSTVDKDQDRRVQTNCALDYHGGWWYDNCRSALLNSDQGIYWKSLCTDYSPCQSASIMIRPNGQNC